MKATACPVWSTATQLTVDAQETELTPAPETPIAAWLIQFAPLKVASASASALTARQKAFERQDTETAGEPAAKAPQAPGYLAASPNWSTVAQKDEPTQDTEFSGVVPSMSPVELQVAPSYGPWSASANPRRSRLARWLMPRAGFEPATSDLGGRRSIQLSYRGSGRLSLRESRRSN